MNRKRSLWTYSVLAVLFVGAMSAAYTLPTGDILAAIAGNAVVVALVAALFKMFRDEAAHDKERLLKHDDQRFQLGVTSHMANTVFDRHVVFCEEYMAEVNDTVVTLVREHESIHALEHANNLFNIRRRHATWVTTAMSSKLSGFEDRLLRMGAQANLINRTTGHPGYAEQRQKAIETVFADFDTLLPQLMGKTETEDGIAAETVVQRVRQLLDIDRLVDLRARLVEQAHATLTG